MAAATPEVPPGKKVVQRTPEAAAAHGKALYAEAMARMQQREQLVQQVRARAHTAKRRQEATRRLL
eukprot:3068700-Prymnesium_polylepis.1